MRALQLNKPLLSQPSLRKFLKYLLVDIIPTAALLLFFAAGMIWINIHF